MLFSSTEWDTLIDLFPFLFSSSFPFFLYSFHIEAGFGHYSSLCLQFKLGLVETILTQNFQINWKIIPALSSPQVSQPPQSQLLPCPLHLSPLSRNLMAKPCSSTRANLSTLLLIELVPAKCNNTNNFVHFHYLETRNLKWNIPKLKHFYFVGYKVLTMEIQIHKSVLNSSFIISNSKFTEWTWVFPRVKITLEQIDYFFIFNYTIKLEN